MINALLSKCASLLNTVLSLDSNPNLIYSEELSKEVTKYFYSCNISVYIINSNESRIYAFPNNITTTSPFFLKLRSIFGIGPLFVGILSVIESWITQFNNSHASTIIINGKAKTYQTAAFSPIDTSGMPRLLKNNKISTTRIGAITLYITDSAYVSLTDEEKIAILIYTALLDAFWIKKAALGLLEVIAYTIPLSALSTIFPKKKNQQQHIIIA